MKVIKETTLHPDGNERVDLYPKTNINQVEGLKEKFEDFKENKSNATNIENGTGTGSLVQKRLKSDGATWTTAKAYQGASTALGGGTQAGRTEEEFNAYFWDSTKNVPLNGGAGKNSSGEILDNHGLTYKKSYSFGVAEGEQTKALGRGSHSEGYYTETEEEYSHAEGWKTVSRGLGSHTEGNMTQTIGNFSHAEGFGTTSKGACSHAEGMSTEAIGDKSHTEGFATRALEMYQHVEGVYNADNPNALHIVGNGTSENARKNAFEVLKDGRAKVQTAPKDNDDVVRKGDLANIRKLYKHDITKTIDGVKITLRFFDSKSVSLIANEIIIKHNGNNTAFVDDINNTNYMGGGGILNAIIPTSKYNNIIFEGVLYGAHKSNGDTPYVYIYDSQSVSTFLTGASYTITEL